jgi:branched-chain amino acid transport system ATP-binding protein
MLLQIQNISKHFGGLTAINNLSCNLMANEIVGLIGPNGAGKTTLFNCISGFFKPEAGKIILNDVDITGVRPDLICHKGIARTFQNVKSFGQMTLLDNVMVGSFSVAGNKSEAKVFALKALEFVGLIERADDFAKDLTIGNRKKLEVARAMATNPKLILLDEVMAGLNSTELQQMLTLLRELNAQGVAILLIEHIMAAVMTISTKVIVIHHGEKIAEGSPSEVSNNKLVIEAYFGEECDA